jgi:hypothetical protein
MGDKCSMLAEKRKYMQNCKVVYRCELTQDGIQCRLAVNTTMSHGVS